MKFIADFHIHSKYSRATSSQSDIEHLAQWAEIKGIDVLGTGDFTHPLWFKELKQKLEPAQPGFFKLKPFVKKENDFLINNETRFVLSSEISCIYSKNGKVRKIHIVVLAPTFNDVEKINARLSLIGNLKADGRPILGIDTKLLFKMISEICPDCFFFPAHAWTPWFGIFGSKSGFDSLEECFEEYTKYIYAIETGLSSDPPMNWRLTSLDRITLVSNSDAHSPQKIGREANVFDTEFNYFSMIQAIKEKDPKKFLYTIEFFPQEGKYHFDGHRECHLSLSPQDSKKYNNICPRCGRPLTLGVLHRVEELADRPNNIIPDQAIPYKSLVGLKKILAEILNQGENTKRVEEKYFSLVRKYGNELKILEEVPIKELENESEILALAIKKMRQKDIYIEPGFDGVFGKVKIFSPKEKPQIRHQETLF